jgi:hypothetical protein
MEENWLRKKKGERKEIILWPYEAPRVSLVGMWLFNNNIKIKSFFFKKKNKSFFTEHLKKIHLGSKDCWKGSN